VVHFDDFAKHFGELEDVTSGVHGYGEHLAGEAFAVFDELIVDKT